MSDIKALEQAYTALSDKLDVIFEREKQLKALCRQLVGACEKTTWLLHRRALDPQEVTILVEMESALEAAGKAGITNG